MRARAYRDTLKHRVEWGSLIIAGCFLLLGLRVLDLQTRQHARFKEMATQYHVRRIPIPAARGILRDRNGNSFTQNLPLKSVYAVPRQVKDPADAARRLSPLLDRSPQYLEECMRREKKFVWLRRKVDRRVEGEVRALKIKGINFISETRRTYPLKTLAAHLIGFADTDGKGIEGLERQLERTIGGTDGWVMAEVDAMGGIIPGTVHERHEAQDGHNVTLTLDARVQHITETAIQKAFDTYQAAGICAVVIDVRTGEILAMANRPTLDPNRPGESAGGARRNRCVTDVYEPGSTLKSITVSAALQEHAITPANTFGCGGTYQIGRRRIRCVLHGPYKHGHGSQTIRGILRESCNIGTAQIGARLGGRKLYHYIADFGFLGDTRLGLMGEQRGMLEPPDSWAAIKLANVAFGQGVAVTPLQIANAYAAIANGGRLMQPYLIRRIEDSKGNMVEEYEPRVVRQVLSPETARIVTECLKVVVEEGTGKPARVEGYSVAGKTGSAQKVAEGGHGYAAGRFVASFVGYAPADSPRIAAIVVVDEPKGSHWGATTAAPAFQQIIQGSLWCLKVPPDRPVGLQRAVVGRR